MAYIKYGLYNGLMALMAYIKWLILKQSCFIFNYRTLPYVSTVYVSNVFIVSSFSNKAEHTFLYSKFLLSNLVLTTHEFVI